MILAKMICKSKYKYSCVKEITYSLLARKIRVPSCADRASLAEEKFEDIRQS